MMLFCVIFLHNFIIMYSFLLLVAGTSGMLVHSSFLPDITHPLQLCIHDDISGNSSLMLSIHVFG